jgi:hypothetical protein
MTTVEFKSLSKILSSIGGFKSALFTILTLLSPWFFGIFVVQLAKYIKEKEMSVDSEEEIIEKIKHRLSYHGLYRVHD